MPTWQWLILIVATSLSMTVCGFIVGVIYQRWHAAHAWDRAARKLSKMLSLVDKSMLEAEEACERLSGIPRSQLSDPQKTTLLDRFQSLQQTLEQMPERLGGLATQVGTQFEGAPIAKKRKELAWVREPIDERTNLPDYSAFEANLTTLLESVSDSLHGGLLFVQIDKFDTLRRRIGDAEADVQTNFLAKLVIRNSSDEDLICQCSDHLLAVLLIDHEETNGQQRAESIRKAIRAHRFRHSQTGDEILMTASFGYYGLEPGDCADIATHRASEAIRDATRRGRNHLIVHDGRMCRAS